jgi:hypothetical protein
MPTIRHLALVSDTTQVKFKDLVRTAAALQTQVTRDFAPVWHRPATVAAFAKLTDVPLDHWIVSIRDDIPYDAQGIHVEKSGSPLALVLYSSDWSLTTSHEILEMLADPRGNRTRLARSIKPRQGDVRYLVEVCDPCEAGDYAYLIGGVAVSDFYFPVYLDPLSPRGTKLTCNDSIHKPLQVLPGGYLSWQDPTTKHWWQRDYTGTRAAFKDRGMRNAGASPRRFIDGRTTVPPQAMRVRSRQPLISAAAVDAVQQRAHDVRAEIRSIVSEAEATNDTRP